MKKLLSIILTILMLATSIPFALAADTVASGTCGADGDNLTWTLDSEGTLTISGEGVMAEYDNINMPEYGYFLPPWAGYKENIKAIVVEEGVTELGLYAFYGHTAVKDVSIADSVTAINGRVFDGCSAIEKLIIPAGVNVLECTAFQNCSSLKQIVFLGKVNFNGSYSFDNCPELREIVFVKGATNIGAQPYPFCLTDIKATEPIIHFGGTQAEAQNAFSGIFQSDRFYSVATIHYMDNCNCSVCGEYHIFEDGICEVCGKECNFTGEYETDENAHWCTCSDDDCNAIFKEYHSFENGICSVCEYECQHLSYVNGICNNCNYKCPHENYVEYKCDVCGLNCPHENIVDSQCLDCGLAGKVVTITMYDNYLDGWNGNAVVISKLLADGSYEEIDTVTYDYGNQSTHYVIIGTDDSFVLTWIEGYADYDSTFEVAIDGETVFESEYFYNYEDGEVVYIYCKHTFEKDVCTVCGYECNHDWSNLDGICANGCGYECPHESYTDGKCGVCGYECPHESYTDGKCGVCGYECPHEKVTDGICDACAAEVNIITITMNDSYGDGWNGNAVVIKQFVDGVYTDTEAGTATIEDGESGTFTTVLPKDGIFALSWLTGEFPSECSFTIAVDGETVYECADGSTLTDGQMIYVTCEHTSYTDGKCDVCGYECTHESYTDSKCDACGYICTHEGQNGSCQVCGANLGELVIDVTDEQYVHIGIGEEYYDEDGYIITGNNPNVEIWVYEGGNYTLDGVTAKSIVDRAGDDTVNITLKGNNVFTGSYSFYKADLIINAVDGATLKALYVTTSGNDGTLTVNGGDITFAYEGNENYNTLECKKIIINGGTVTASNSAFYTVDQNVELNGGILNVVNTSTDFEAISNDVIIDKGALLTISSTYKLFHDAYDILKAEGLAENDFFFVRYDTESEFVPVQDIESALNGKAYAEIKIDTHEHSYTDGICDCGYVCLHVNFADGICPDCTASGKLVAIKMSDSNNNGWYGKNAVVIKQLVDGAFEEVETATLTDGKSGTVAVNLDKDGTYVITWQSDYYPNECGFEIYVDGECVYSISDARGIENNAILYTICEHTGGKADCLHRAVCENCGNEYGEVDADGHDWSNKDGVCDNCEYACPHENVTGATCITPVKCDVCGYSVFDWTNHEGEYVTVWYNDYQHVSEYECCHIGSSIVYGDHDYKDYTVTTPADCVNNAWETGTCICGDTHVREIADSATDHNWSNKDGICANGCGETCPHESYTDGVCDKCGEECAHEWDEGVLTRPVYDAVLGSKDGCYTYTCTVCGKEKKENVKSADYSAYEAVSEEINALLQSEELTPEAKQAIYSAANECGLPSNDLTESEQNKIDSLVAELEKIVADAEEKIASGEYVKADYTEIDEAIASVDEALENATISEEMANELSDIKSQLEALKENENTSIADAAELLERVKAVAETMADCANGIHSFTKYEEVTAPECGKTGLEKAVCDYGCGATDEREIPALTHEPLEAVKENEVAPKCGVAGSYDLVVYCDLCGDELDRDTVTVDALTHKDDDGDYKCDHGCGHEFEKPAEPDTPDEPADGDCDHLCHKSGIMSIFWKIIRFFYRLFNIQQYCDCGVIHYDAPVFG